jgi:hypothetical protein
MVVWVVGVVVVVVVVAVVKVVMLAVVVKVAKVVAVVAVVVVVVVLVVSLVVVVMVVVAAAAARAMTHHPRDEPFGGASQHGVLLRRRAVTARQRATHHGAAVLRGDPSATTRVERATGGCGLTGAGGWCKTRRAAHAHTRACA